MSSTKKLWLHPAVLVASTSPLFVLLWQGLHHELGANPVDLILNRLGRLALVFLVAMLAVTPLKTLAGWSFVAPLRRSLGLIAFAYATLHFLTFAAFDKGLDVGKIAAEVVKRPFILVGFAAWVILTALAVTTPVAVLKRMGAARWKMLHKLVYVASALAAVHFYMRVKKDVTEPVLYASIIGALLLVRVVVSRGRAPAPAVGAPVPPPPR